jgi:hypothetical protein
LNFLGGIVKNTEKSNCLKISPKGTELFHADRHIDRKADTGRKTDTQKIKNSEENKSRERDGRTDIRKLQVMLAVCRLAKAFKISTL